MIDTSLRARIADLLAVHWFGPGGCQCKKQNGVEWTYHMADIILAVTAEYSRATRATPTTTVENWHGQVNRGTP